MKKVILCSDVELEASAAIALLAGDPNTEILGIVAGSGRVPAETAVQNACSVLGYLGKDIPVVKGTGTPMVAGLNEMRKAWELPPENWPEFGPVPEQICPRKDACVQHRCGVIWLIETLEKAGEEVTILTLGPLTDLALALRVQPSIAAHIGQIVIVGGGHRYTDISAAAEFNIRCDPEAAAIVFGCDVPKCVIPLDCAYSARIREDSLQEALEGTQAGAFALKLIRPLYRRCDKLDGGAGIPLPMLLGACFVGEPNVLPGLIEYSVDIDFSGGYADGQTIFDTRRIFDDYNCRTAFTADSAAFLSALHKLSAMSEMNVEG